jgi:hypothetical protein
MQCVETISDDVAAVQEFVSQMRALCARLTANPFNTPAAEALLDLLLDIAPAADLALVRVMEAVIGGSPLPNEPDVLGIFGDRHDQAEAVCM